MIVFPLVPRFMMGNTALCPYNDDASLYFHRWFSDNELITNMGDWEFFPIPYSNHTALDYVKNTRKTTWLICAAEPDDRLIPIGYTGIYIKHRHRIGIFRIAIPESEYRKKGHAFRATTMFLEWAFAYLDLFALHLSVTASNIPAVSLYKKCGFVECGKHTSSRHEPDGCHDEILMELLREDWEKRRKPDET